MIELFKFCKKEHNPIFGCENFQFGTLNYYREMESAKNIADSTEGLHTVIIDKYDSKIDKDSKILKLTPFEVSDSSTNIEIHFENVVIENPTLNCYVFCLSINRKQNIIGSRFCDNYDSFFKIKDLIKFIGIVSTTLMQEIKIQNFQEKSRQEVINESTFKGDLKLFVVHAPVNYSDLKTTHIENNKALDNTIIPEPLQIIFTKDKRFSPDEEYRIAFIFEYHGRTMNVETIPILVPCKGLSGIIE